MLNEQELQEIKELLDDEDNWLLNMADLSLYIPKLIKEIEQLREENKRYREALEEIANDITYECNCDITAKQAIQGGE